eukprot:s4855_g3.t1
MTIRSWGLVCGWCAPFGNCGADRQQPHPVNEEHFLRSELQQSSTSLRTTDDAAALRVGFLPRTSSSSFSSLSSSCSQRGRVLRSEIIMMACCRRLPSSALAFSRFQESCFLVFSCRADSKGVVSPRQSSLRLVPQASLRRTPSTLPPILADGAAPASSSLVCSANFFSTSSAFLFALAFAWACRARRISAPTVAQRSSPSLWPWLSTPPGARFGRPSHAYTACHWTSRLRTLIVTLESSSRRDGAHGIPAGEPFQKAVVLAQVAEAHHLPPICKARKDSRKQDELITGDEHPCQRDWDAKKDS